MVYIWKVEWKRVETIYEIRRQLQQFYFVPSYYVQVPVK